MFAMLTSKKQRTFLKIKNGIIFLQLTADRLIIQYMNVQAHQIDLYQIDGDTLLKTMGLCFTSHQMLYQYLVCNPERIINASEYEIKIVVDIAYQNKCYTFPLTKVDAQSSQIIKIKIRKLEHEEIMSSKQYKQEINQLQKMIEHAKIKADIAKGKYESQQKIQLRNTLENEQQKHEKQQLLSVLNKKQSELNQLKLKQMQCITLDDN